MFNTNANIFPLEQPPPNNYVFEMRNFKKQIEQQQKKKTPRGIDILYYSNSFSLKIFEATKFNLCSLFTLIHRRMFT